MVKRVFFFLAVLGLLALLMPGHGPVSRHAGVSAQAPSPPPFTFDKPLPDPDTFVHLPPFIVADLIQAHTWWARASGGNLGISLIARIVSAEQTGSLIMKVYDPSGFLVDTRTLTEPVWPVSESESTPVTIPAASGDLYRIEVTVPPPVLPPGEGPLPLHHYGIKLGRGSLLGTNSPLQTQPASVAASWGVNVTSGESLDVVVKTVPLDGATSAAVNVFRPDNSLHSSFPAGTSLPISVSIAGAGSDPGMWMIGVADADGHYILEKTSGADLGIYVNWKSLSTAEPLLPLVLEITDTVSVSDVAVTLPPLILDITDIVSVSDVAVTLPPLVLDITDTVRVSDAAKTLAPLVLDITDTVSVSDVAVTLPPLVLDITDTVSVSDDTGTELHTDEDGVRDDVEDGASNGGDGNNDGTPDSEQDNVTSLPDVFGEYVTIASDTGTTLSSVETRDTPADAPSDVSFPSGVFQFTVNGLTPGASTTVTLTLSESTSATTYYKYGPTPSDTSDHWYEFLYDDTTGAVINGNEITLYLVDGQRGDHDLTANGEIVEPGAPGREPEDGFPLGIIVGAVVGGGLLALGAGYLIFRIRRQGT